MAEADLAKAGKDVIRVTVPLLRYLLAGVKYIAEMKKGQGDKANYDSIRRQSNAFVNWGEMITKRIINAVRALDQPPKLKPVLADGEAKTEGVDKRPELDAADAAATVAAAVPISIPIPSSPASKTMPAAQATTTAAAAAPAPAPAPALPESNSGQLTDRSRKTSPMTSKQASPVARGPSPSSPGSSRVSATPQTTRPTRPTTSSAINSPKRKVPGLPRSPVGPPRPRQTILPVSV